MTEVIQKQRSRIDILDVGIIVLTLLTALIHIYLWTFPDEPLRVWFLLNGIGYIILLVALFLTHRFSYRHVIPYVLMAYAALTVVCYVFLGQPYDTLGVTTKVIELLLIILLLAKSRRMIVKAH